MTPLQVMVEDIENNEVTVKALRKEAELAMMRLILFEDLLMYAEEFQAAEKRFAAVAKKFEKLSNEHTDALDNWLADIGPGVIDRDYDLYDEDAISDLKVMQKGLQKWVQTFEQNEQYLLEIEREAREEDNE